MAKITIYGQKQFYLSKYNEKQYLNGGEGDNTLIAAALLTGKGLGSEEYEIYTAYGDTEQEAQKALQSYISQNPNHPQIYKTEKS